MGSTGEPPEGVFSDGHRRESFELRSEGCRCVQKTQHRSPGKRCLPLRSGHTHVGGDVLVQPFKKNQLKMRSINRVPGYGIL